MAHGETNGNGALEGLPRWVRSVAVVGLPGVFALVLIWLITSGLPANAEQAKTNAAAAVVAAQAAAELVQKHIEQSNAQQHDLERLLIRICLNTAKDAQSAEACWGVGRRP